MFNASKYNKGNKFDFRTPESFQFTTLETLYKVNGADKVYTIKALYINRKSQYGDHPVIVTDAELVDCPKHLLDTVENMINDDEAVEAINSGKVGFSVYTYKDKKHNKTCYSVNWEDI